MSFNRGIFFPLSLFESTVYVKFCMQQHGVLNKDVRQSMPNLRCRRVDTACVTSMPQANLGRFTCSGISTCLLDCMNEAYTDLSRVGVQHTGVDKQ